MNFFFLEGYNNGFMLGFCAGLAVMILLNRLIDWIKLREPKKPTPLIFIE